MNVTEANDTSRVLRYLLNLRQCVEPSAATTSATTHSDPRPASTRHCTPGSPRHRSASSGRSGEAGRGQLRLVAVIFVVALP